MKVVWEKCGSGGGGEPVACRLALGSHDPSLTPGIYKVFIKTK